MITSYYGPFPGKDRNRVTSPKTLLPRLPFRHFHHQVVRNGDDVSRTRSRYSITFICHGPDIRMKIDTEDAPPIGRRRRK